MLLNFSSRGQVSAELLAGVLLLFIFLIIVFVQNFFVSDSTQTAATIYKNHGACVSLAFSVSKVYSEGSGAKINFWLDSNAQIISVQKFVKMGDDFCSFLARTTDANLTVGNVTLSNVNGVVVFS